VELRHGIRHRATKTAAVMEAKSNIKSALVGRVVKLFEVMGTSQFDQCVKKIWETIAIGGSMAQGLYVEFFVQAKFISQPGLELEDTINTVQQDWEVDRQGKEALDLPMFADALFILCDRW
jgi:hypothetical protein